MPVSTEDYLIDLEEYFLELERIKAEFDVKITVWDSQIIALEAEIADIESQVSYWAGQRGSHLAKWNSANAMLLSYNSLTKDIYVSPPVIPEEKWPAFRAEGYNEIFMYDHMVRLRWFPDLHTLKDYFYDHIDFTDVEVVDISWFYDKPIVESLRSQENFVITPKTETPNYDHYKPLLIVPDDILANYKSAWGADALDETLGGIHVWGPLETQVGETQAEYYTTNDQYLAARDTLESRTRHLRDLQLAKEAAEEERRNAIALWEAEFKAAQERKRIEIESIARDVKLGYPTMDAETARVIAETAYGEAITLGLTRVADALNIAMELADDWYKKQEFPHYTRETITCPSCSSTLEITSSDIEEHNRDLACPLCNTPVGRGVLVRVIDVWVEPPPPTPVVGIARWLKANWPYLAVAGLGTGLAITLVKRRK